MARHAMTGGTRTATHTPDGHQVVERQYNSEAPHPHPDHGGRLVATTGLNQILTGDGDVLAECDECGYTNENPRGVVAHFTSHNGNKTGPDYDIKTLRVIVATTDKYKTAHRRNFAELAAAELNEIKVRTRGGRPWTAAAVSSLWRRWKDDERVMSSRRRVPASRAVHPAKTMPRIYDERESSLPLSDPLTVRAATSMRETLITIGETLRTLVSEVDALTVTVYNSVDPTELAELRQKAQELDDMKRILGRR